MPTEASASVAPERTHCHVFRCSRQTELYLYIRDGLPHEALPGALLQKTGRLTKIMALELSPERKLARVEVQQVIRALNDRGFFLQMPPEGGIDAHLDDGD